MRIVLRSFFRAEGTNPWLVVLCLLAGSLAEGAGLVTLLPLLSAAAGSGDPSSPIEQIVHGALAALGIPARAEVLLVVVMAGLVLRSLLRLLAMRYVGFAVAEVATNLRRRLVEQLMNVRWSYLLQQPMGRFSNALSGEANRAAEAYRNAATMVAEMIEVLIMTVLAFLVSWQIGLAAVLVGGVIALVLHTLVRMARKAGRRQTETMRDLISFLNDTLNNIKPVKAMARQSAFTGMLDRKISQLRKALRRSVVSTEALKNMQEIMLTLCLGFGALAAMVIWQMELVALVVVAVLFARTVKGLSRVQAGYQRAVLFEAAAAHVDGLLAETAANHEPPTGARPARFERHLRFDNVSFAYGPKTVLRDASFEITAGSITTLIGPSGVGKSTITDLVLGLQKPQSGRLLLDDVPLDEIDLASWRGMIGYVPQELVLFHDTIFANVVLGDPRLDRADVEAALRAAGAWEFVAALPDDVMTVVGERGAMLSGGQRQRIALARALVVRPRLLILDEFTSALDLETERLLLAQIAELEGRTTVLVVTHRPSLVELSTRVFRVDAGRVIEEPATEAVGAESALLQMRGGASGLG
ncbi:MAG TPA: ABC transporter ATP-binding protein [Geminicoccaceae bacterium]|nr:ABC transporter ATP-binding protein [Geminicoccaceae bacterium]